MNNLLETIRHGQKSRQPSKKGYWIDVTMYDDNDELITVECRVEVDECRDAYELGSPTTYEVYIHEALLDGDDYELSGEQELIVDAKAIVELT